MSKNRRWSGKVTATSHAMDIEPGLFTRSADEIAKGLKKASVESPHTKGTKLSSAMSMLNFEINRAGTNLSPERRATLEEAKQRLRDEFKK